jgi:SAM-dependent methyltransferase
MGETDSDSPLAGEASETFLEVSGVPVHVGVVWPDAASARRSPRGDVRLELGRHSGFIANTAFDEGLVDYTLRYDNALHFSPTFRAYEEQLARRLCDRYGLRGKDLVEIGAGGGHFLGLLCEMGDNRGTGFDPSHHAESADARVGGRVSVVRDYYSERYADHPADFITCRHVLEHIPDPRGFLHDLRRTLEKRPGAVVYFEVPNAYLILRQLSIWDVIYEHCGYFVPESLGAMFRACGFEILDLHSCYDDQFVGIEARPGPRAEGLGEPCDLSELGPAVGGFARRFDDVAAGWRERLATLTRAGRSAAVWGAGAKTVSFMNLLEIGDQIAAVVDINPGKQGSFLAGTGHEILAPEALREIRPDVVIVMNPIYRAEIERDLAQLSPRSEVASV